MEGVIKAYTSNWHTIEAIDSDRLSMLGRVQKEIEKESTAGEKFAWSH